MSEIPKEATSKVLLSKNHDENDDFRNNEMQTVQNELYQCSSIAAKHKNQQSSK